MLIPNQKFISYYLLVLLLFKCNISYGLSKHDNQIAYQKAASYTHILWSNTNSQPLSINLLPIQNFSGIPIERRSENADYFSHGKIPAEINLLSSSLVQASHQFRLNSGSRGDYQFQFVIEKYQLPQKYAPNDNIWQEYKDEVDRWFEGEKKTQIKLTLKITSANKPILPWTKSVSSLLSKCDLNLSPQPLLPFASNNKNLLSYIEATPAQAFIAANNFLIIEAIQFLKGQKQFATIEKIHGGQLVIKSRNTYFKEGDKLSVHHENHGKISNFPIGLVEVVKTFENQATAYPLNFKPSQVKVGDRVTQNNRKQFIHPDYKLDSKNSCGMVQVIEATAGLDQF